MGRELNEFSLHSRDGIKLNGRLGKDKWGVGEIIIERERETEQGFAWRVK